MQPTEHRHNQIIRLLETLNEGLPEPSRHVNTTAGFVNEPRTRTCPDCTANGRTMKGCETCHGTGTVTNLAAIALTDTLPDDGQIRDPYATSDTVQAYGVRDTAKVGHIPERDAQIDRARKLAQDRTTTEQETVQITEPYVWERERKARRQRYDYPALEAALEVLRDQDEPAYKILHAVYVYAWSEPTTTLEAIVHRALIFIDQRMPTPIRAPGDEKHQALARRDRRTAA